MAKKMAVKTNLKKPAKKWRFTLPSFPKQLLKLTVVFSLLVGIGLLITKIPSVWSGIWPIKKVAIVGDVEHLDESQLARVLFENDFGGMLSIDLQQLRRKLTQLPWIKDVQVRKIWPDTLSFKVEEHWALAQVNQYYLTEQGKLIERGGYVTPKSVLQIDIDKLPQEKQQELLDLYEKLQQIQTRLADHQLVISQLSVGETNQWIIQIKNRFVINVGRKNQLERIEKFVQVFVAIENKNKLESIDLRYSNGLAVKFSDDLPQSKKNG